MRVNQIRTNISVVILRIAEAAVLLPAGAKNEFGPALVRVLTDDAFREALAERSRLAQERYFSWSAIAAKYAEYLRSRMAHHETNMAEQSPN